MAETFHNYDALSSREGFNRSLRHFRYVTSVIEDFEDQINLAEILNEAIEGKAILSDQVIPVCSAILVDKYGYGNRSYNLEASFEDFDSISAETEKWSAIDLVAAYFHPELGVVPVNPKRREHWEVVQTLRKHELITLYAGCFQTRNEKLAQEALTAFIALLKGKKSPTPANLTKGSFTVRRQSVPVQVPVRAASYVPAPPLTVVPSASSAPVRDAVPQASAPAAQPVAAPSGAPKKMTPMYGIPVTNELFHNGNVEAWKKIINSYMTKYVGLDVYVFYEGERIHDINTLFKWGKVKHGSSIMISVAGDEIKDVAKLQRYLKQGASHMFEAFLHGPPNKVLSLF